MITAR